LLRSSFVDRFPGLYVPPIPPKKTMGNMDRDFVAERCYFLNLFIKQMVKCPYLFESDELKIFIRPQIDLEKALTLLPRLTSEEMLERTSKYFSIMGEISETSL